MVLRCSLLGHDFGETEVEREREERGSEVVVTVQEYQECSRCDERTVISENTEVTSLATGTDADSLPADDEPEPTESPLESDAAEPTAGTEAAFDDAADAGETVAAVTDAGDSAGTDAESVDADDPVPESDATVLDDAAGDPETDAEFIDPDGDSEPDAEFVDTDAAGASSAADSTSGDADAATDPAATDDVDLPTDEHGDPVTDDGEILEDDDDPTPDRDRERGEWPDSDDVGPPVDADAEPTAWPDDPDAETADADADAEQTPTPADDAVVLENDMSTESTDDARSVTAEPPSTTHDTDTDATATSPDTGIERADSIPTPTDREGGPADDVPTAFYCPRCDYVAADDRPSLRAGDICPDCRKGYLSERERERRQL